MTHTGQNDINSTPSQNSASTPKQRNMDKKNAPEIKSPLLSGQYDEQHLFQNTPLFQTLPPGAHRSPELGPQLAAQYELPENQQDAQLSNTFLNIIPNIQAQPSRSTLEPTARTSSVRILGGETDPTVAHMISPHIHSTRSLSSIQPSMISQQSQQEPPQLTNWQSIKRMLARMKPEKGKIIIGMIAMMIGSLCTLLIPLAVGKLVDIIGKDGAKFKEIRPILFAAMVAIVINAVANFVQLSLLLVAGDKVVSVLRIELFKALIYREISFFDVARVGELLSRLSTDVGSINHALTIDMAEGAQRAAVLLGSIAYMIYISWDLSLVVFLLAPIIGVTGSRLARIFHAYAKRVNNSLAQATVVAEETLTNIRTVRSLGLEYTQQLRYNEKVITSYGLNRKQKLMRSGQRTFVYFAAGCAVVGVLWYGSWKVIQKQLTPGNLLTFIIMGLNVGENIGKTLDNYTNISSSAASCSEALNLVDAGKYNNQLYLDYKELTPWHRTTNDVDFDQVLKNLSGAVEHTDMKRTATGQLPESVTAGTTLILDDTTIPVLPKINFNVPITFEGTHFTYPSRPGQPVLKGVDMVVFPCTQNAFVGASGSGKSSAMSLLLQMYQLNGGKIKLGGTDISQINPVLWRSSIGYVEQMPTLFNTTILDNVLTGVSNFKLHDCHFTLQQIRAERENQKKLLPSFGSRKNLYRDDATHIDDVESASPRHGPKTDHHQRRSSADLGDDDDLICPCRSNPDLPLCQDLFGRQYTLRDVENACRMANAHDFITEFDEGYYTQISGVAVSGGQAQRLSIARCFLRDSQLILLDEVSSALDPVNEDLIVSAINKLVAGKTVITIAHRLSTIKHIGHSNPKDTIFVFKGGDIIERGTHQELMARPNGEFRKLSELQQLVAAASQ